MPQLGLLLWLLAAPMPDVELPPRMTARPCEAARQMAARGACLRPEDCGAYRDWKRLFGAPGTEPLGPQLAERAAHRPTELPRTYLCLAPDGSVARQPSPR